ncbi:hypothetical protein NDU88_006850 [Pleurodeles waltl]|uniref:Uncharacterized protein n=1 Tax=Pleurodeles waltl TaxID=8319 RepID=A0AAV7WBR5_PLEWA|nr:hypothetical protein NDU88_006850 [Pleurodeles waltl]
MDGLQDLKEELSCSPVMDGGQIFPNLSSPAALLEDCSKEVKRREQNRGCKIGLLKMNAAASKGLFLGSGQSFLPRPHRAECCPGDILYSQLITKADQALKGILKSGFHSLDPVIMSGRRASAWP